METIDRARFEHRLLELFRSHVIAVLPRRPVDRHILFKSAILMFGAETTLDETAVNAALARWQATTGVGLDYVTWRRHLVDAGYLLRDRARTRYCPARPPEELSGIRFAPDVDGVDVPAVVEAARSEAVRRKREHLSAPQEGAEG